MSSLQTLVETIVSDLIKARHEADVQTAKLAEVYKDHPILRTMAVPSLNISNVSVDLRVAFDEQEIEQDPGPSEQQRKAINAAATKLRANLMGMKSVTDKVTVARQKTVMSRNLLSQVAREATEKVAESPEKRRAAVNTKITALMSANKVQLNAADRRKLAAELNKFDKEIADAPKAAPRVPGVVVGAEKLKQMNPEMVTSIKFDIDLDEARWSDTHDGEETRSVLSRR
ncbi:MAG: hypothetical protein AAGJ28_12475 [Pseudomonadota bacterium]